MISPRPVRHAVPVDGDASATLSLHGQTKPVNIRYHAGLAGDTYSIRGSTTINILDFGITQPSFLGVTVSPNVGINVQFQVKNNP